MFVWIYHDQVKMFNEIKPSRCKINLKLSFTLDVIFGTSVVMKMGKIHLISRQSKMVDVYDLNV